MKPTILPLAIVLALPLPLAAQYTLDPGSIPSGSPDNASRTENVDFGDVDLDGDWDIVMADGGDGGNDQNRIWINQGGLQGGAIGSFLDETQTRFPAVLDQSRDIELADYDGDGDLDVFVANTAQLVNQTSRFWTNLGLEQGGTIGAYADETQARWVGLGGPGSSIAPALVLASGGFIDWNHDGDFADLDNDGDLDLLHTSLGGAAGGLVPTRIFLNDGAGFFSEFNPSGFQLASVNIANGDPGIWAQGTQQSGTLDASGVNCDVATVAEDADVGDIDGDLDLDLLLGDRNSKPRMFANALQASPLAPAGIGFRDVTGAVFLPSYVVGSGAFEQEMGDLDGDGDLDLLGVNWGVVGTTFADKVLENDGSGHFFIETLLPGSFADDNEGDLVDFDSDGKLDIYIANFSGQDRLYRNVTAGAGLAFAQEPLVAFAGTSLDADAADVDGDGDPEMLVGLDYNAANVLLDNGYDVPDTHAPEIPLVESVSTPTAFAGVLPVRAQVYDNAPYYVAYFTDTVLSATVDGVQLPVFAMKSSGGQIFRGELPGNLVGGVQYRVFANDEYGNSGASAVQGFAATGDTGALYGTASSGGTASIASLTETHAGMTSYLHGTGAAAASVFVGVSGSSLAPTAVPGLPNLVLNVAPPLIALANGTGEALLAGPIPPGTTGAALFAQTVTFDGATFESSRGLALTILP